MRASLWPGRTFQLEHPEEEKKQFLESFPPSLLLLLQSGPRIST
jgi:hypothetical protein